MSAIPEESQQVPENVLRKTRALQKIAAITIVASILSYPFLAIVAKLFALSDAIPDYPFLFAPPVVALSILLLGIVNVVHYYSSRRSSSINRTNLMVAISLKSALWIVLSLISIPSTNVIIFMFALVMHEG